MGEYARRRTDGERIKIGTCEDMLYLRDDQRRMVFESETNVLDPDILEVIRFRFPWPDEDMNAPGDFDDPFRRLKLWGVPVPEGVEHGSVQFTAQNGYLTSLPCPEGPDTLPGIHRNGYGGPCALTAQAWRGGRLVGIAECNGCRHAYRLEDGHEEAVAVAIRSMADREIRTADDNGTEGNRDIGKRLHTIADRLLAGYLASV